MVANAPARMIRSISIIPAVVMVVCALLFVACLPAYSDCSITPGKWKDYDSFILENSLIRVVVIPASNGRIAEYIFKPSNTNQFRHLNVTELEVSPDYTMSSANMAGYEDWIWEVGAQTFAQRHAKYRNQIVEQTPGKCSVQVSFETQYGIERTVSITDNSTVVDIQTKMTNLRQGTWTCSYWSHIMVEPGGLGSLKDLLITSALTATDTDVRSGITTVKSRKDALYISDVSGRKVYDIFIKPSQSWLAMVNQQNKVGLLSLVPIGELGTDGFFYSNGSDNSSSEEGGFGVSLETVYQSKQLLAGENNTYHQSLASCMGIDRVVYADGNVIVGKSKTLGDGYKYLFSAPRVVSGYTAELSLVDSQGNALTSARTSLPGLSPDKAEEITFDIDASKVPAAGSERKMTISSGGKSYL